MKCEPIKCSNEFLTNWEDPHYRARLRQKKHALLLQHDEKIYRDWQGRIRTFLLTGQWPEKER